MTPVNDKAQEFSDLFNSIYLELPESDKLKLKVLKSGKANLGNVSIVAQDDGLFTVVGSDGKEYSDLVDLDFTVVFATCLERRKFLKNVKNMRHSYEKAINDANHYLDALKKCDDLFKREVLVSKCKHVLQQLANMQRRLKHFQ